jgi:hypothetical protein
MTIRVIPDPGDITLTQSELHHLQQEWKTVCMYIVWPPTFEEFVRSLRARESLGKSAVTGDK